MLSEVRNFQIPTTKSPAEIAAAALYLGISLRQKFSLNALNQSPKTFKVFKDKAQEEQHM